MAWPIGNKFHLLVENAGRPKKYTKNKLANACAEYFKFIDENPLKEEIIIPTAWKEDIQTVVTGSNGEAETLNTQKHHPFTVAYKTKKRPYTVIGLCNHLNITLDTFKIYEGVKDLSGVAIRARQMIEEDQIEGAATGFYNSNIVARLTGLIDKKEVDNKGAMTINITTEDAKLGS